MLCSSAGCSAMNQVQEIESKKRKLQALLAVGTSQAPSFAPPAHSAQHPSAVLTENQQLEETEGGFFRDDLHPTQRPAQRDHGQQIHVHNQAKDGDGLDDSWIMDDSDVQLAVKVCCSRFPRRRECPPLALYTHLKDVLRGQSNLDLDRELKRLEESKEVVMFKFATSGCDVAVTPYSEFQKVLSKLAADEQEQGGSAAAPTGPRQNPGQNKSNLGCVKAESARRLRRLLESGAFSVQMRTDELAQRLAAAIEDAAQDHARADTLSRPDTQPTPACAGSSRREPAGNPSLAELQMRKSAAPFGRARATHKASNSAGTLIGAGWPLGAGAAQFVDCLLQAGFLVRHQMGPVEMMRLTAPGAGSVMAAVDRARNEIRGVLKRKKRREAIEKTLVGTTLKSSTLGWPFHLSDMVGAGLLERITHGNSTVIRLLQTS